MKGPRAQMKHVRVFVLGKYVSFVLDVLRQVGAIGDRALCYRPEHDRLPITNEMESLMMVRAAVPEGSIPVVLAGLGPFFNRHAGALLVSDFAGNPEEAWATATAEGGLL